MIENHEIFVDPDKNYSYQVKLGDDRKYAMVFTIHIKTYISIITLVIRNYHRIIIITFKEYVRCKICNRFRHIFGQSIDYTQAYYL